MPMNRYSSPALSGRGAMWTREDTSGGAEDLVKSIMATQERRQAIERQKQLDVYAEEDRQRKIKQEEEDRVIQQAEMLNKIRGLEKPVEDTPATLKKLVLPQPTDSLASGSQTDTGDPSPTDPIAWASPGKRTGERMQDEPTAAGSAQHLATTTPLEMEFTEPAKAPEEEREYLTTPSGVQLPILSSRQQRDIRERQFEEGLQEADITRQRAREDYQFEQENKAFSPSRYRPTKPDIYFDKQEGKNALVQTEQFMMDPERYGPKEPENDAEKADWVWNNEANSPEYVSRKAQLDAPKGLYSDKVSGRQSGERAVRGEVMSELIKQTDVYITRYQKTLEGPRGFLPSWMDPEKYRDIDAVRSATGSLAQFFGRTVLGDYRVSDQDRPVYQNAIASLNEAVNIVDPDEILMRWENGKKLFEIYNQNFGGAGQRSEDPKSPESPQTPSALPEGFVVNP